MINHFLTAHPRRVDLAKCKAGSPPKPIVRQTCFFLQPMAMQQEAIQEEVPTIYKAYFLAYVREYPQNIWPYMVLTYLHFRILKCLGESCFFLHCQTVVSTICRWLAMFSFQVKSLWSWPIFPGTRSQLITEATSSIQKLAGSWLRVFFPWKFWSCGYLGQI